jgi:hypothetical protein
MACFGLRHAIGRKASGCDLPEVFRKPVYTRTSFRPRKVRDEERPNESEESPSSGLDDEQPLPPSQSHGAVQVVKHARSDQPGRSHGDAKGDVKACDSTSDLAACVPRRKTYTQESAFPL